MQKRAYLFSGCLDPGFFNCRNLLPNGSTHNCFEACASDVFTQCIVDQGLIVATSRAVHHSLKMLDNIIVEPNGDSSLSRSRGHDRTAPSLAEIILPFHLYFLDHTGAGRAVVIARPAPSSTRFSKSESPN
jgi:hypothetical protein